MGNPFRTKKSAGQTDSTAAEVSPVLCINNNCIFVHSKFNIGQDVWYMKNNRLTRSKITRVNAIISDNGIRVLYNLAGTSGEFDDSSLLFELQQELIDYLKEHVIIDTDEIKQDKDIF